ncbi:MAG: hydroxymethylglutaryl-CoA reductase [Chitinophagales bacterium]|nr:hydroxymethylglutaryl-CoA reductase [Chitinophagales bacterium]
MDKKEIQGFSKLPKEQKLQWLADNYFSDKEQAAKELSSYWHRYPETQKLFDEFAENTISNFYMPFGVAPNFLINGRIYAVPMVIEESSVVAAASMSAKQWLERGGFHAEVIDTEKIGQVHFLWQGEKAKLDRFFAAIKPKLFEETESITANMQQRGGGILGVDLVDLTEQMPDYYQVKARFETCDSMGANFINSVLEKFAAILKREASQWSEFEGDEKQVEIIMSILSNYTPNCLVRAWVSCKVAEMDCFVKDMDGPTFVRKFSNGVRIAQVDPYRATTHNKGIFNGIDAVVLATGNDFRAVEACGHVYAGRNGQYSSLTNIDIQDGQFTYTLEVPLSLGTVGGLTTLHPMVRRGLEMLGNPSARELMMIAASVGLANNFSAVRSLVTVGIQKGHMKMHLLNILKNFEASEQETELAKKYFVHNIVSYTSVREFLELLRSGQTVKL